MLVFLANVLLVYCHRVVILSDYDLGIIYTISLAAIVMDAP